MAAVLEPDQLVSLKVLGSLYLRLGAGVRACRLFQALIQLFPEDVELARSLAAAELEAGNAERALTLLSAPPLDTQTSDPVSLLLKARAHWRLEQNEAAFAAMDAYLSRHQA
jgi:thioredoxin-like negative regulator of GroEL